ncbi:NAD(P)-binding protein [Hyaloscypha variabilis]
MSFPYKTVLVLGATSGIGLAIAETLVENGSHVIAVGRRKENLESFVSKHGKDKASSIKFDITDLSSIPSFAESVTKDYPTLDSIIINSGIQRSLNFTHPQSIDLSVVDSELTTNYLSPLHLTKAFLPFLQSQSSPTSLIFTTSGLALTPIVRCGNYCASKAAMHHLILVLREQLKESNVKVVEILPPAVQTELHDAKHQLDMKDGGKIGMPLEEFMAECWEGLVEGKEDVPVGMVRWQWGWEEERRKRFGGMVKAMSGGK